MSSNQVGLNTIGEYSSTALIAGDLQRVTAAVTLLAGAKYPEGSVLGKITASGKCTLVNPAASDGSQDIFGILSENVDATAGDRESIAFLTGEFALQRLAAAAGVVVADLLAAAREKGIFFREITIQADE